MEVTPTQNDIIYRPDYFKDPAPLVTGSVADFLFFTPHAQLDDTPAFTDAITGTTLSRARLYGLSLRLAKGVETLGMKHEKTVAMIFSQNSISWPLVFFGLQCAGVAVTLANSAYTPRELAHQITNSDASLIFVQPVLLPTLVETLKSLKVSEAEMKKRVVVMSFTGRDVRDEQATKIDISWMRLRQLLNKGKRDAPIRLSGTETDATALMCYSSGTTGLSKGVETTHRNILTMMQICWQIRPPFNRTKDVEIGIVPFYHVFGIVKVLCYSLWTGVHVVITPKFEPILFFKTVEKYKISMVKLVPPIVVTLATHPDFGKYDLSSLWFLSCGAAPMGEGIVRRVKARFEKEHKCSIYVSQNYGLTETSPLTHVLPIEDDMRKIGSVGVLLPSLELRLVDDNGNDVKPGMPGEAWMRGPSVMKGYRNNPAATTNAFTEDGWFKSGDIAIRDNEGFFYIVDRKKELIKYKGTQVPPAELEAVLLTKDDIADAGVIGVECPAEATELPRAYVVSTKNATLLADPVARAAFEREVEEWIKPQVAKYKYLRGGVKVIDSIPKTLSGKILRRHLRERAKLEAKEDLERSLGGAMARL